MNLKAPILLLCWLIPFGANAAHAQPDGDVSAMLERVLPAVVTVAVERNVAANQPYGFSGNAVAEAYLRTLDLSGAASSGSGFVVHHEGRPYVVTNAHVIERAAGDDAIFVYAIDQTRYPIRIVGADSFYDIAVLAFRGEVPAGKIGSLQFKTAPPRLGERVFAVGNPLGGYPYSVSDGIVGGLNRMLGGLTGKFGYLQSTATIVGGNSGGPLVDAAGYVVGINSSSALARLHGQIRYSPPQLNFALESGLASRLVADILTHDGRVRRAFLGLEVAQYHPLEDGGNPVEPEPPILAGVLPGSPAARALAEQTGQRIVAVDGVPTRNLEEVQGALEAVRPGAVVTLTLETPRGQRADHAVVSEELSRERLAELARYFFEQKGLGRAVEENGRVLVRLAPNPPPAQPGQSSRSESDAVMDLAFDRQLRQFLRAMIEPPPRPRSLAVAGAGIA